jgi:heterodisulfide reductase subunit B
VEEWLACVLQLCLRARRAVELSTGPRLGAVRVEAFDSATVPCNDVAMPDRNLKIARLIGSTPSIAYCDLCKLIFKTRQEFLVDADKAKQQLQSDFDKHECKPEPGTVDNALDHVR